MFEIYIQTLLPVLVIALLGWGYSLIKRNVNIVDSLWSLMFLAGAGFYLQHNESVDYRAILVFILVSIWAIRLSVHLAWRNWGHDEDHRYQTIRSNNEPGFRFKSLYIVFGLQGALAWIISIPLLFSLSTPAPFSLLDVFATCLWLMGFYFEAVGDYQLAQFRKSDNRNQKVLDYGLWAYTRHPNYFGEFCIWWSFYLFAIPAGGWWTIYAPLLMSFLLLKVSGVVMMEKDIGNRRPEYRKYIASTPAFFPGFNRKSAIMQTKEQKS